jgi:isopenicillin-N epimerase
MNPLLAKDFYFPADLVFLNHGSFGACPKPVLEARFRWLQKLEENPIEFLVRDLEGLLQHSLAKLAALVGAKPADMVFVPNATAGVNTVIQSIPLRPGDEVLVTNHEYRACRNALDHFAQKRGFAVKPIELPHPVFSAQEVIESVVKAVSDKTRLLLIDHITSPTAMILPVKEIVTAMRELAIETLIDGAHAPGMIPLDIEDLSPTYYTGNCHKWLCAPKGAGFLWVSPEKQNLIYPLTISLLRDQKPGVASSFQGRFAWIGTLDYTSYLCVGEAIDYLLQQEGGFSGLQNRNRELAIYGRNLIIERLTAAGCCPENMLGSMATVCLPAELDLGAPDLRTCQDPISERLFNEFRIEVPVHSVSGIAQKLLRLSAFIYSDETDFRALALALEKIRKQS